MKLLRYLLFPFSLLFGLGIRLRNLGYDLGWLKAHRVGVPVISIGNISLGGTGKTPMAEFLLGELQAMGYQPAYLSRGYGRKSKGYLEVDAASASGLRYGDEAFQVACKFPDLPVAVCEDRVAGATRLLEAHAIDVLVLDDAFQHRRIHRDFDIVMVDGNRPPHRDLLLPAGNLREPLSGLRRAGAVLVTKLRDEAAFPRLRRALRAQRYSFRTGLMALRPVGLVAAGASPALKLDDLRDRAVVGFSGLGNNAFFEAEMRQMVGELRQFLSFPDHHEYSAADLSKISAALGKQIENKGKFADALLITTEKDFFRLKAHGGLAHFEGLPLYYLQVALTPVIGWEQVAAQLEEMIHNYDRKNK